MDLKKELKRVQSLKNKKNRQLLGEFIIEGKKIIEEAINSNYEMVDLFLSDKAIENSAELLHHSKREYKRVSESWLERAGNLKSNNYGIAILKIKELRPKSNEADRSWDICLLDINDPGNLGTIMRTADWYGIKNIYCSRNSVDVYNPKTLMASKGSFLRVDIHYVDLHKFLVDSDKTIFAADLEGESVHTLSETHKNGILLMGSESHGIPDELKPQVNKRIKIGGKGNAESLNVGIATSIILDNFNRLGFL